MQYTSPFAARFGLAGGMVPLQAQSIAGGAYATTAGTLATPRALSVIGGATVNFDGSNAVVLPSPVQFGSGAPSGLVGEGVIYFDTGTTPYTQYVQHTGAWHTA